MMRSARAHLPWQSWCVARAARVAATQAPQAFSAASATRRASFGIVLAPEKTMVSMPGDLARRSGAGLARGDRFAACRPWQAVRLRLRDRRLSDRRLRHHPRHDRRVGFTWASAALWISCLSLQLLSSMTRHTDSDVGLRNYRPGRARRAAGDDRSTAPLDGAACGDYARCQAMTSRCHARATVHWATSAGHTHERDPRRPLTALPLDRAAHGGRLVSARSPFPDATHGCALEARMQPSTSPSLTRRASSSTTSDARRPHLHRQQRLGVAEPAAAGERTSAASPSPMPPTAGRWAMAAPSSPPPTAAPTGAAQTSGTTADSARRRLPRRHPRLGGGRAAGTILATTDGGAHWQAQNVGHDGADLSAVAFPDATPRLGGGRHGRHGASSPPPTAAPTGGAEVGDRRRGLYGVAFIDATHGWAVGGDGKAHTGSSSPPATAAPTGGAEVGDGRRSS